MNPANSLWWSSRAYVVAMMLAAALPLLWPSVPPLVDLPGHMGRYAIQLADPASPLHHWYRFEWAVIGNLGVDLLVVPLSALFGLELAVKLVVLAIPPLTVAGLLLSAREAHGEIPPTAALALPFVYGYPLQFGFVNFALSMAMALLAFALWLRLGRTGRLTLRAVLFVPIGIALWFVHSFGWGVFGLTAFAAETVRQRAAGRSLVATLWHAGLAVVPLTPPMALMLLWRSGDVAGTTGDWFRWDVKFVFLMQMLRNEGDTFDIWSAFGLMLVALFGLLGFGVRRAPQLVLPGLLLVATFVLLPRVALGSAYADMRLAPYMIAVLLIAFAPRIADRRMLGWLAIICTAFFLGRMAIQTATFVRLDGVWKDRLVMLDAVPRGSRLFVLAEAGCHSGRYPSRLAHLDGLALVRREAFTNGQWAMAGAQLVRVVHPAGAFAVDPSQIVRPKHCIQRGGTRYPEVLTQFPRDQFDYLWLIDIPPAQRPRDSELVPVREMPGGALYRIRRTPSAG